MYGSITPVDTLTNGREIYNITEYFDRTKLNNS